MLPSIALALGIEELRDGGSLCAAFQGANGSIYWLVFPVILDGDKIMGYSRPVVVERPYAPQELHISWPHAKILLQQVDYLISERANRKYIGRMYAAIQSQGKID